ncbi:helix-turn-helix domain-containing protein [Pusillimonas sp. ANT_WB101]|uniref:helix-turn-helix domain-containing protein n=1 Tax=Pusillimonas sp. ANT_WB101 TaxID=2597356 RepID=UPI0011EC4B84|nr:helix-turn-helix domain-containing protein [Pusillimonas sp. ANT_WB101]KAA0911619.1 helix-turn-helix domain-containing protein [Pusillimonas sp. ANT_WB101]
MDPRIQYCVTQIEHKILHDASEFNAHDALIQDLAKHINLTRFHLSRLFLKDFKYSPREYIQHNLMGRCALMIAHTAQSMFSIAIDMGFSSQQAFTRAFTKYWGLSPQHFRQAHAYYIAKRDKLAGPPIPGLENLEVKVQAMPEMHFWAARYEGLSKQKHACWNDFRHLFTQHAPEGWEGSFFGLTYDTPMFTPQPFMRYYCGVLAGPDPSKKPKEAFEICLPAGRVATVEAQCMAHDLPHLYDYLLDHWLPRSGYSLRASCFAENFGEIPVNWDEQPVPVKLACWIH